MTHIDWQKDFPVASICRADIKDLGFTEEQIAHLSDEDMECIAFAMEDLYCDEGYWEDLEECARRVLEQKEEKDGNPDEESPATRSSKTC